MPDPAYACASRGAYMDSLSQLVETAADVRLCAAEFTSQCITFLVLQII